MLWKGRDLFVGLSSSFESFGHFTRLSADQHTGAEGGHSADSNCGKIQLAFGARYIIYLHNHENSVAIEAMRIRHTCLL